MKTPFTKRGLATRSVDNMLIDSPQGVSSRLLSDHTYNCFMKHILPFVTGFVTFMIVSGVYYMGLTEMPTGGCFPAEPDMAVMMLGNALYVALTVYTVHLSGTFTPAAGAKQGAIVALLANGFLNLLLWGFIVPIDGAMAVQDIVANIPMMAVTGAAVAYMYGRGAAKDAA